MGIVLPTEGTRTAKDTNRAALELMMAADAAPLVTFREFRDLMERRNHDVDGPVDLFRGKIEDPREFFERVMMCKYHHEDRSDAVIPYRSVLEFYRQELHFFKDITKRYRICSCGCGRLVSKGAKWANPGCKKRVQRKQVTDIELSASN